MFRQNIILLLCNALLFTNLDVKVQSPHVLLMNRKTKRVLYEKNARHKVYPASTTKIATALWILQKTRGLDLNNTFCTASVHALKVMPDYKKKALNFKIAPYLLEPDGTTCHIRVGERLSYNTLINGMLLASGNDASNVLAESFDHSINLFMQELNVFLRKLGLKNTHFVNPHGLHHPDHYTTAYDMALIATHCLEEYAFRRIVFSKDFICPKSNLCRQAIFKQGNQLIKKSSPFYYEKAYGLKTGKTRMAGFNLVAAAKHQDRDLIAVIHKAKDSGSRYKDAIDLFHAAFNEKKEKRRLFNQSDTIFYQPIKGARSPLQAIILQDVELHYYPSEIKDVTAKVSYQNLNLPIKQGQRVGYLYIYDQEGLYVDKHPLFSASTVEKTWSEALWGLLTSARLYTILLILAAFYLCLRSFCRAKSDKAC